MASIISARHLRWKGSKLYFEGKIVGRVVPDGDWPGMWRVIRQDGSLSDMANLTRARDAAIAQVLRDLNGKETGLGASLVRQDQESDPPATVAALKPKDSNGPKYFRSRSIHPLFSICSSRISLCKERGKGLTCMDRGAFGEKPLPPALSG
jgi:hypothetical protein